jgi:hypothetical protein
MLDEYQWQRDAHNSVSTAEGFLRGLVSRARSGWRFYLAGSLSLPLLFVPWIVRDRRTRLLAIACCTVFVAASFEPLFQVRHLAPVACAIFALAVQGLRHLHKLGWRGAPVGATLVWLLVCIRVAMAGAPGALEDPYRSRQPYTTRGTILRKLRPLAGKHLIFVRYGPTHNFHSPAIYNDADIDASPVVWARELDPASDAALRRHYRNRRVWLFEPDADPPRLTPR